MRRILLTASIALATLHGTARAQSAEDKAAAEASFEEGRKLVAAGNFQEACPKFEASQHLDPAPGTELNLADCYEKLGRFASAWGMFQQAGDDERRAGDGDAEKVARDRAKALVPKLSRLTIQLPKDAIPGLAITRNDEAVRPELLGTAMPVDAGAQHLVATAPGRIAWTSDVTVQVGDSVVIPLPALPIDPNATTTGPGATTGPTGPTVQTPAQSELQITVGEPLEQYEIELATAGGVLHCQGEVTREHPCSLKAPPGTAVLTVHGAATLSEDIEVKDKPVIVSVDKTSRYLFYSGAITAGVGAVALGIGLYACSQRGPNDISDGTATGLTCVAGAGVGGAAVVAGGALMIWDLLSEHHEITTHGSDDQSGDADTTARRLFTAPTRGGAVLGLTGRF